MMEPTCAHSDHACHGDHAHAHSGLGHHDPKGDVVCIENVSFSYQRRPAKRPAAGAMADDWALRDITLHVERGANVGIIGPNGAGKTTLLRIVVGLLEPSAGSVSLMGMKPRAACRRGNVLGYVPQRSSAEWRFPLSVRQVVQMGLCGKTGLLRRYSREDIEYADHMMERAGVADLATRPAGELSGGQQQRLLIARSLVARPTLLILDEPMSGIDEPGQEEIAGLIRELHQSLKLTVLIVSHDIETLAAGCSKVACINKTIHYHDVPERLTPEVLRSVFRHRFDLLFREG
jgi:ABC-type Mn2+/Zn2+ transport system ATPase subunit